ncbi:reverse transcriptase [Tanacetum coccineum]
MVYALKKGNWWSNGQNGGSYDRLTNLEFPKFDGVKSWLYRVNKFFEMDNIGEDEQKIRVFGEVVTWEVYQIQVKKRFESAFEDPVVELKNLKQTTSVQEYIAYAVRMFKPTTLADVFCLSKLQEASNSVSRGKHSSLTAGNKNNMVTNFNRGGGNVTRNVTTIPAQNHTHMPNRPFKKLTQQELEEKRAKHLCFYCDQKYEPSHKCSGQLYSLEVIGEGLGMEEDEEIQLIEEGIMSTYTTSLIDEPPLISLNALTCENSYGTMRVRAYVRKNVVHTLVDCGSTHNFLDWNTARKLGCKLRKICPLEVSVANGNVMSSLYE